MGSKKALVTGITGQDGSYLAELLVTTGRVRDVGWSTVTAATTSVAPNADAGPDRAALTGATIALDGTGSFDPDELPQPLAYQWSFLYVPDGSAVTDGDITDADTASASFTPDATTRSPPARTSTSATTATSMTSCPGRSWSISRSNTG